MVREETARVGTDGPLCAVLQDHQKSTKEDPGSIVLAMRKPSVPKRTLSNVSGDIGRCDTGVLGRSGVSSPGAIWQNRPVQHRQVSDLLSVPAIRAAAPGWVHGDDDQIVPYADSAPLSAKLLKNGTLKTYKVFPHGMPTTQAATINADLLAFFKA